MRAPPPSSLAVHLTLRWRHDVIAVRRVGVEGVPVAALAPIPCAPELLGFVFAHTARGVPAAFAPPDGVVTVWREGSAVEIVEGPAVVSLGAGDVAELPLGDFVLSAVAGAPEVLARSKRKQAAALWGVALAAAAHAGVLALAANDARASADDGEGDRTEAMRGLLAQAELRARAEESRPIEDGQGKGRGQLVDGRAGDGRAAGGTKAPGDEGKTGDRLARPGPHRRYAVERELERDPAPAVAREEAMGDAAAFGMIGLLGQGSTSPSAPSGGDFAHGADAVAANGDLWARAAGNAFGEGGLGLSGTGEGGGGRGEGIGLGNVGTLGHGTGRAGFGGGGNGSPRFEWQARPWITGGFYPRPYRRRPPEEIIAYQIKHDFGRFRACYEAGLSRDPSLAGTVTVRFIVDLHGGVSDVHDAGSTLPDAEVVRCVVRALYGFQLHNPDGWEQGGWGRMVTVSHTMVFSPP